jgi:2-keto-4-pentenoate hydratase
MSGATSDADIEHACALLIDAHRYGRRFLSRTQPAPSSLSDVYRIHRGLLRALAGGTRVDTWKVSPPRGATPATASPVLPGRRLESPAITSVADFQMVGIEAELAFRFRTGLPPRAEPYAEAEIHAAVQEICVAIELCDTRLSDWADAPVLWRLADLQSGAMLIVGDRRRDWQAIDFAQQDVELSINGELRTRCRGTHPTVDPARLLPAIVAHCAEHGDGLCAGDVVTTGSWTGMTQATPGDAIRVHFPGVGSAELVLER